jgi:hypothetical protein
MTASSFTSPLRTLFVVLLMMGAAVALTPSSSHAQEAKNSVYVELAGNSLFYSVNYDRLFNKKVSGRLGVMTAGAGDVSLTAVPLVGNYLFGSGSHRFEVGAGPQLFLVSVDTENADGFGGIDEDGTAIAGTATLGYRYQPMDGGFQFRIGFTPSFSQFGFLPWAGLSLGYAF